MFRTAKHNVKSELMFRLKHGKSGTDIKMMTITIEMLICVLLIFTLVAVFREGNRL